MRIIPVIDVMGGQVVRAVGGRRSEYRPIRSLLTDSSDPVAVARALTKASGASELYLADLDAIRHHPSCLTLNESAIRGVTRLGLPVWVDAGLRNDFDEVALQHVGADHFIIGTETASGEGAVGHLAALHGADRVALSIDMANGELIGNGPMWGQTPTEALSGIIEFAQAFEITRFIVIDLAAVGGMTGPLTAETCRRIKALDPNAEVWTGGGIRDWDDVRRLEDAGADAVLVASALHDGTLRVPVPTG
jgi:phosphoribosylformimino-5-aminoimidazole carboxamide ribotide isomerase